MHGTCGKEEEGVTHCNDELNRVAEILLNHSDSMGLIDINLAIEEAEKVAGLNDGPLYIVVLISLDLLTKVNSNFDVYQVGGRHSAELMVNI